jgi:tetratricopeptide (TPR) repeat protein
LLGNLSAVYSDLPTGDRSKNLRQAIEFLNRALEPLSKYAYPREYATLHNNLATLYASLPSGDSSENFKQAIAHYKEALLIYTIEVYPMQWAATQNNLGTAYSQLEAGDRTENLRQAIASYERALSVYTQKSFPYDWLRVSTSLGTAYADVGDWQKAKQLATSVLQAFHGAIPDQESLDALIPWYERLGDLAINNQDVEFATRVFAEVAHRFEMQEVEVPGNIRDKLVRLREQIGDDRFVIIWGEVQGALTPYLAQVLREATQLIEQGQFEPAENKFSKALEILSEAEDTHEQRGQHATILFQRGFCLRNQERWEEALIDLENAFHLFEELKDFGVEARVLLEMGHIYGVMNNYEEARLHYMDAYRLYRRANNKSGMAMASESLGQLEFVVRMFPQAIQDLEEARQLYIQLGERGAASAIESNLEDAKASFSHQEANAGRRGKQK